MIFLLFQSSLIFSSHHFLTDISFYMDLFVTVLFLDNWSFTCATICLCRWIFSRFSAPQFLSSSILFEKIIDSMKRKMDDQTFEFVTFELCIIGNSTKCSVRKKDLTTDWLLGKIEEITSKTGHRVVPSMQFISIWVSYSKNGVLFEILGWKRPSTALISNSRRHRCFERHKSL